MLLAPWFLAYFHKGFRSFSAKNLGSVGQRAAKLLAVKVGGLKKKSAGRPRPHTNQSAQVRLWARFYHSLSLTAGNFTALWPTDFKFSAIKDLNLLKKYTKNQEASSILRVDFALSKWPHFHREFSNRPGMVVRHCTQPQRAKQLPQSDYGCTLWAKISQWGCGTSSYHIISVC